MAFAPEELTSRQHQIATLAGEGLRNKEIAQRLGLAEGTVKLQLHSIYAKLRIRGRMSLRDFVKAPSGKHPHNLSMENSLDPAGAVGIRFQRYRRLR